MAKKLTVLVLLAIFAPHTAPAHAFDGCVFRDQQGPILYYFCPVPNGAAKSRSHWTTRSEVVQGPAATVRRHERVVSKTSGSFVGLAQVCAERHNIDLDLIRAVITVESRWNAFAVSRKGARGLMQLMPDTARRFSVSNSFDPAENICGGTRYLRELRDEFRSLELTLAAYNAGEDAVRKYRGIPPYGETRQYVRRVVAIYRGLQRSS